MLACIHSGRLATKKFGLRQALKRNYPFRKFASHFKPKRTPFPFTNPTPLLTLYSRKRNSPFLHYSVMDSYFQAVRIHFFLRDCRHWHRYGKHPFSTHKSFIGIYGLYSIHSTSTTCSFTQPNTTPTTISSVRP